jgi:tetratricopeptide (TPR) repeat protein
VEGYTARDVSKLLGVSVAEVRGYVRAGLLSPERGPRRELRFTFQDLVLMRTARALLGADLPPRRVRQALRRLRQQLPEDRPITGVAISADGKRIVVRDGRTLWQPESGQALFDFDLRPPSSPSEVRTLERKSAETQLDADSWYDHGCALEDDDAEAARSAYRRALSIEPDHADAHVNLGRLLHEMGDPAAAERHYLHALGIAPEDAIALFNLGVALEDQQRPVEAIDAYERALALDPNNADAHYNAARLYERRGQTAAAIRHLRAYRKLVE